MCWRCRPIGLDGWSLGMLKAHVKCWYRRPRWSIRIKQLHLIISIHRPLRCGSSSTPPVAAREGDAAHMCWFVGRSPPERPSSYSPFLPPPDVFFLIPTPPPLPLCPPWSAPTTGPPVPLSPLGLCLQPAPTPHLHPSPKILSTASSPHPTPTPKPYVPCLTFVGDAAASRAIPVSREVLASPPLRRCGQPRRPCRRWGWSLSSVIFSSLRRSSRWAPPLMGLVDIPHEGVGRFTARA
jgi:hypothetical protein